MSILPLLIQLSNGTPCEIPAEWLCLAMQRINECFDYADINVLSDGKIAQLSPNRTELNEFGRWLLS